MGQPLPARWTYEEFARLPEDGNRYEVIGGQLYVTPSPRPRHQRVLSDLLSVLAHHVRANDLGQVFVGPIDVLFAEGDYLEPDLIFVRSERMGIVSERGVEAAPDLVVEVLSPSTGKRDRTLKRDRYLHFGVPEYWVVDPDGGRIEAYRSSGDPRRPEVYDDVLPWRPWPGAEVLELDVGEVVGPRP